MKLETPVERLKPYYTMNLLSWNKICNPKGGNIGFLSQKRYRKRL